MSYFIHYRVNCICRNCNSLVFRCAEGGLADIWCNISSWHSQMSARAQEPAGVPSPIQDTSAVWHCHQGELLHQVSKKQHSNRLKWSHNCTLIAPEGIFFSYTDKCHLLYWELRYSLYQKLNISSLVCCRMQYFFFKLVIMPRHLVSFVTRKCRSSCNNTYQVHHRHNQCRSVRRVQNIISL